MVYLNCRSFLPRNGSPVVVAGGAWTVEVDEGSIYVGGPPHDPSLPTEVLFPCVQKKKKVYAHGSS